MSHAAGPLAKISSNKANKWKSSQESTPAQGMPGYLLPASKRLTLEPALKSKQDSHERLPEQPLQEMRAEPTPSRGF